MVGILGWREEFNLGPRLRVCVEAARGNEVMISQYGGMMMIEEEIISDMERILTKER